MPGDLTLDEKTDIVEWALKTEESIPQQSIEKLFRW